MVSSKILYDAFGGGLGVSWDSVRSPIQFSTSS
jgi:hypothetical protein